MIDINEINKEIKKLEQYPLTYSLCEKLASLYIIKDHYDKEHNKGGVLKQ